MSAVSTRAPRPSNAASCSRRVAYQLSASRTSTPVARARSASAPPTYPAPSTRIKGEPFLDPVDAGAGRDDVPRVHDQLRLVPVRLLEELAMLGEHDDAVRLRNLFRRPVDAPVPTVVELDFGHPRIAVDDVAAPREQLAHHLKARRLARVVDVRLVCHPEQQDPRALDRAVYV